MGSQFLGLVQLTPSPSPVHVYDVPLQSAGVEACATGETAICTAKGLNSVKAVRTVMPVRLSDRMFFPTFEAARSSQRYLSQSFRKAPQRPAPGTCPPMSPGPGDRPRGEEETRLSRTRLPNS